MPKSRSTARPGTQKHIDMAAYIAALDHPRKAEIEAVRGLILGADPRVREEVKWNAPSFFIDEHFATFKLRPTSTVQVVLHTGAKVRPDAGPVTVDDPAGLLTWAAPDRCLATFRDAADVEARGDAFVSIVRRWIAQTARADG
jgi:hypothetical protein